MSEADYYKPIDDLKAVAEVSTTKSRYQYYILNKYEVLLCGDVPRSESHQKTAQSTMRLQKISVTYFNKAHTATDHMVVVIES